MAAPVTMGLTPVLPSKADQGDHSDSSHRKAAELDVSAPSLSGRYIQLEKEGKVEELLRLQEKRDKLRRDILIVTMDLGRFENQRWLLEFYIRTKNRGENYGRALKREADRLERQKVNLAAELDAIERKIARIDRVILAIEPLPQGHEVSRSGRLPRIEPGENAHILVRDYTIKKLSYERLSDQEICRRLDLELASRDAVPLGIPSGWVDNYREEWQEKYGWNFYLAAYEDTRTKNLMQKMISKAKKRIPS
jgi:hypothetical protein